MHLREDDDPMKEIEHTTGRKRYVTYLVIGSAAKAKSNEYPFRYTRPAPIASVNHFCK